MKPRDWVLNPVVVDEPNIRRCDQLGIGSGLVIQADEKESSDKKLNGIALIYYKNSIKSRTPSFSLGHRSATFCLSLMNLERNTIGCSFSPAEINESKHRRRNPPA